MRKETIFKRLFNSLLNAESGKTLLLLVLLYSVIIGAAAGYFYILVIYLRTEANWMIWLLAVMFLISLVFSVIYYFQNNRLYNNLHEANKQLEDQDYRFTRCRDIQDVKGLITVLTEQIDKNEKPDAYVVDFYLLNLQKKIFESTHGSDKTISFFTPSTVRNSLWQLKPLTFREPSDLYGDRPIRQLRHYGNLYLVPIYISGQQPHPDYARCKYYSKTAKTYCWTNVQMHIDNEMGNCLECPSFLPVGVFVISARDGSPSTPTKIFNDIRDTFGGIIRKTCLTDRALHLLSLDSFTGLLNRSAGLDKLWSCLVSAKNRNEPLSLFFLRIDHFDKIEDTYGYKVSDRIILIVGTKLKEFVPEYSYLASYGRDIFMMILPGISKEAAINIGQNITAFFNDIVIPLKDLGQFKTTLSVGIATFPDDEVEDFWEFLRKANIAVNQSSKSGNITMAYTGQMPDFSRKALLSEQSEGKDEFEAY